MKRFYKTATAQTEADGTSGVRLDGRPVKTPAKAELRLPTLALAEAIAAEWAAQQDEIQPMQMPLMRLATTAIDRVAMDRSFATADILRYGETDLLAYRATEPAELVARQAAVWQPLLDWFRERYDVDILVTSGIIAVPQPAELQSRLLQVCDGCDPFRLTALHAATTNTGSVVLGLALLEGRVDARLAGEAGLLDELYQAGLWGEDAEAAQRRGNLGDDLAATERFLSLLKV
jgi:chaperone required for assembly of F1-ATPase